MEREKGKDIVELHSLDSFEIDILLPRVTGKQSELYVLHPDLRKFNPSSIVSSLLSIKILTLDRYNPFGFSI